MMLKLLAVIAVLRLTFANDGCFIGSPACENVTPDFNATFGECCNSFDPLQRQDSFGSGPGMQTCIRCATLGCHVDKNCASETGDEVATIEECCAIRNRRSFRNPDTGTCHLCANCFFSGSCNGVGTFADDMTDCCAMPGARRYRDPMTMMCERCPDMEMYGDPHFIVPLLSKELLCYSIQGYPGLAFNLIYNKNFIINAQFVDSVGDTSEATWIGKLAVIPHNSNSSEAIIFDSAEQTVTVVGRGSFKASIIKKMIISNNDKVKFIQGIEKQTGNPTVHVSYTDPRADFDVSFHSNHLNVDWNLKYDEFADLHGLMGQFMRKGVDIDIQREMLIYSDGRDPVPVTRDSTMTGDANRQCWKVMNYGHQGEGLIKGKILDYVVPHILSTDFNL
ncbi:inter-alpha-trypsin inhibitor heavy chain H3-like isoform X1 [Dysidea avara]|uniref:inter-alpha-trypsin inhibitor heavy chain H3-like isoform X1 n=1 Tax=Dysidea avara TaxID=196820 RepID=UPI00332ED09C